MSTSKKAKSEQVAQYFADLAKEFQTKGYKRLEVFLDRNPTHKTKMQNLFKEQTAELEIDVKFHLMAAYSPKLNIVEYAIHWIRQEVLHHADCKTLLSQFETSIKECCAQKIFSKEL